MKFSIIIATYNRGDRIKRTIDSVLSQSFKDFELIIIDDGSTDETESLIKALKDQRIVYNKIGNSERGAARNVGINLAKGSYITFLDSDDIFYPNHLEEAHKFIQSNSSGFFFQPFKIGRNYSISPKKISNEALKEKLITQGNYLACLGVFVKSQILKSNLFLESRILSGSEDYELWLRLLSNGIKLHKNPIVTSELIIHDGRGEKTVSFSRVKERKLFFIERVKEMNFSKNKKNRILSNSYSFIALQAAIEGNTDWVKFLFRSISKSTRVLFSRRLFAILKHGLF